MFFSNLKMKSLPILCIVALLFCHTFAFPSDQTDDDDDYGDDEEVRQNGDGDVRQNGDVPEFISTNQTYHAVLNEDLTIGCQVNKLEPDIQLIWSFKSAIDDIDEEPKVIQIGDTWLGTVDKSHIQIELLPDQGGSTLTIKRVQPEDAGNYICTIAVKHKPSVSFHVQVNKHEIKDDKKSIMTEEMTSSNARSASQVSMLAMFLVITLANSVAFLRMNFR